MSKRTRIRPPLAALAAAVCCAVWALGASVARAQATTDVITPDQLAKMRAQNRPYENQPNIKPSDVKPEATRKTTPEEMLAASVILCDGQNSIILPSSAVHFIPPNKAGMVAPSIEKPLATWIEFFARNRGSIKELPLKPEEINGKLPLDERKLKGFFSGGQIVVSTYLQQPVGPAAAVRAAIKKMAEPPK